MGPTYYCIHSVDGLLKHAGTNGCKMRTTLRDVPASSVQPENSFCYICASLHIQEASGRLKDALNCTFLG